ncbi:hypothetical protein F2P56_020788 [Juglans regia]|uniref:Uncharacterized protein LOC108992673 n=2 Tax=Juglans regia TaxID=51240 RepID=A0A2I4ETV0_JUGRE|nr:uncharacterized protein LOC108992673 [Juglans regia]KAF5460956.1 hypothetical protein F2P56_020788 [Juglans regia]
MLQSLSYHFLSPNFPISLPHLHNSSLFPSPLVSVPYRPTNLHHVSALPRTRPETWLAQVPESTSTAAPEEGPIELPPSTPSIFATTDDPSPIQVATSVLLTGAISVFLFRAVRRRAKRAKELKFRSSGVKSLKEEAVDTLRAMGSAPVETSSPPSPVQAFLGGVSAGVIALILYKFATTIEASLNRQALSDSFSVRQITITVRTIVNGLCYLATFVFGANSIGLFLYSGQLAMNSMMEGSTNEENKSKGDEPLDSPNSTAESATDATEVSSSKGDQSSNDKQ